MFSNKQEGHDSLNPLCYFEFKIFFPALTVIALSDYQNLIIEYSKDHCVYTLTMILLYILVVFYISLADCIWGNSVVSRHLLPSSVSSFRCSVHSVMLFVVYITCWEAIVASLHLSSHRQWPVCLCNGEFFGYQLCLHWSILFPP